MFDNNPEMISLGVTYIRSFSFDYLIVPIIFSINGLYTGAGHTTFSLINGVLSSIVLRVPVAFLFGSVFGMGLFGIGLGAPVASLGSLLLVIWFYFSGKWRVSRVLEQ